MKSFIRIALPILLVIGAVSGITIIQMYSGDDPVSETPKSGVQVKSSNKLPLKFDSIVAAPPPATEGVVKPELRHMLYWDEHVEAGAPGHFEFWCQNRNEEPVTVRVSNTNCQCASVDFAVIPPEAYGDYLVGSALAGGPLGSSLASVIVHLKLDSKLNWLPLFHGDAATLQMDRPDQVVPAASGVTGPQFALVRLNWKGKGEGTRKQISAELFASLGEAPPAHTHLEANIVVLPPFDVMVRESGGRWRPTKEFQFGDLRENDVARHTLYLACATRAYLNYSVATEHEDPCVTFSEPVPASEEEIKSLRDFVLTVPADANPPVPRQVKSLQKIEITVRERTQVDEGGKKVLRQLDLGPIDRTVKVKAFEGGGWNLMLKGRVFGEITLLSGAETGLVELGQSLAADQTHSKDLYLLAERPGLDLTLEKADIFPTYLQESKLEARPVDKDGRKSWVLHVILPKNSLFGHLPQNSSIVVKTTGPNPPRFRIPIRGSTFQSSGPRL